MPQSVATVKDFIDETTKQDLLLRERVRKTENKKNVGQL